MRPARPTPPEEKSVNKMVSLFAIDWVLTTAVNEHIDALERVAGDNDRHLSIKELERDGGESIGHRQARVELVSKMSRTWSC